MTRIVECTSHLSGIGYNGFKKIKVEFIIFMYHRKKNKKQQISNNNKERKKRKKKLCTIIVISSCQGQLYFDVKHSSIAHWTITVLFY